MQRTAWPCDPKKVNKIYLTKIHKIMTVQVITAAVLELALMHN